MNAKNLPEKLQTALDYRRITPPDFVLMLQNFGYNCTIVDMKAYLSGAATPNASNIKHIAQILNLSTDYFYKSNGNPENYDLKTKQNTDKNTYRPFGERLTEVMKEKGMTATDIVNASIRLRDEDSTVYPITPAHMSKWIHNSSLPNNRHTETLINIMKMPDEDNRLVPTDADRDYVVKQRAIKKEMRNSEFSKNLKTLLKAKGLTVASFTDFMNEQGFDIGLNQMYKYTNGSQIPRTERMKAIAKCLNINAETLGGTSVKKTASRSSATKKSQTNEKPAAKKTETGSDTNKKDQRMTAVETSKTGTRISVAPDEEQTKNNVIPIMPIPNSAYSKRINLIQKIGSEGRTIEELAILLDMSADNVKYLLEGKGQFYEQTIKKLSVILNIPNGEKYIYFDI